MTSLPRIIVIGGIAADRLATVTGALVAGASNPGRMTTRPGGVGLSLASILTDLGHPVRLLARIGEDDDGRLIVAMMKKAGMATEAITTSRTQPTGTYTAVFDSDGDLVIGVADLAIYDDFLPATAPQLADLDPGEGLCVVDANLPARTLDFVSRRAEATGATLVALSVSPVKALRLVPCLGRLDWLFTNRAEASAILGRATGDRLADAGELAAALAALGPRGVVVTDGGRALAVTTDGNTRLMTPPAVRIIGVNGAGDSLAAGTIHRLACGDHWTKALEAGIAAAALTLEHGGIGQAGFSPARLSERIASHQQDSSSP